MILDKIIRAASLCGRRLSYPIRGGVGIVEGWSISANE
jgi:hypothetical protein